MRYDIQTFENMFLGKNVRKQALSYITAGKTKLHMHYPKKLL